MCFLLSLRFLIVVQIVGCSQLYVDSRAVWIHVSRNLSFLTFYNKGPAEIYCRLMCIHKSSSKKTLHPSNVKPNLNNIRFLFSPSDKESVALLSCQKVVFAAGVPFNNVFASFLLRVTHSTSFCKYHEAIVLLNGILVWINLTQNDQHVLLFNGFSNSILSASVIACCKGDQPYTTIDSDSV